MAPLEEDVRPLCISMQQPTAIDDCQSLRKKRIVLEEVWMHLDDDRKKLEKQHNAAAHEVKAVDEKIRAKGRERDSTRDEQARLRIRGEIYKLEQERAKLLAAANRLKWKLDDAREQLKQANRVLSEVYALERRMGCAHLMEQDPSPIPQGGHQQFMPCVDKVENCILPPIQRGPSKNGDVSLLADGSSGSVLTGEWWQTPVHMVGGAGGTYESVEQLGDGAIIIKIEGWVNGTMVRGLRFHFSNGWTSPLYGAMSGDVQTIDLQGKLVKEAYLHGNGVGTRLGKLSLVTTDGATHNIAGNTEAQQYSIVVGSGLLAGVHVRHGADIDALALTFVAPIRSALGEMEWGKPAHMPAQAMDHIDGLYYNNDSQSDQRPPKKTLEVTTIERVTMQSEWKVSLGVTINWKATMSNDAKVLKSAIEERFEMKLDAQAGGYRIEEKSVEVKKSYEWEVVVKAGECFDQDVYLVDNTAIVPYKSTVQLQLATGAKFTMKDEGALSLQNKKKMMIMPGRRNTATDPGLLMDGV